MVTVIGTGSREDLVKAARMYFLDGRTQDDIAHVFGTSRSNVSRMLSTARSLGIVEIRVQDEWGRDVQLEQALCERFGLAHVRVAAFRPHADAVAAAATLAAEWLDDRLRDGQILGLSWGMSLQAMVSAVSIDGSRQLEVVPLMGGLPTANSAVAGQELVRELAGRLGGTYRHLQGPALLRSQKARDALLAEPSIAQALAQARSADIALVGIGTVGVGSSVQVLEALALTPAQHEAFMAAHPVGNTCCRFFDAQGQPVQGAADDRVLAVDLDDLRAIPTVVGVATGWEKTAGVLGALRGGILDGLIIDAVLAHSVLSAEGVL
jgi:DNA-binding transcriptional regulator LsrR (DeoR family)